jgi:hypothetical protein
VALAAFPEDEVETVFLGDFFTGGRPGDAGGHKAARIAMERRPAGPSWATTTCW